MIRFTRLRLSGFKSFVEPTEMAIEEGLTGVVGPNGCGKSNLVEALRWVMGESSARQMRGSEMDDVIFAGSAVRPRRDVAEVTVTLANRDGRVLPGAFDPGAEIEVTRRIERGSGSSYRVNGKETRARDVQTLFADLASGARSTAIVGQGHIGAIINARPGERRGLLEEAAGIAGLHARRYEAEQKLRAAETNLERLEDVLATLETQWQGLRKQSRHATRYKSLSQRIRETEAALLNSEWRRCSAVCDRARAAFTEIEAGVETLTALAVQAGVRQAEAAAALPGLRGMDADASARLQRLRQTANYLNAEERRAEARRQDVARRRAEAMDDAGREAARAGDAASALARLGEEREALEALVAGEGDRVAAADARLAAATEAANLADAEATRRLEILAAAEAARTAARTRLAECEDRAARLARRRAELDAEHARAESERLDPARLTGAEMDKEEAEEHLERCRAQLEQAESARRAARERVDRARDAVRRLAAAQAALRAEADGLRAVLVQAKDAAAAPVIDSLTVAAGCEAALGAALGEDLSAPAEDGGAARFWRELPDRDDGPALPENVPALAAFVESPPALSARLAQIGLVEEEGQGVLLQEKLAVGQRLVSRDGALWRWDGFTQAAGTPSSAAARLRQQARLRILDAALAEGVEPLRAAETEAGAAAKGEEAANTAEAAARSALKAAEMDSRKRAEAYFVLAQKAARIAEKREALDRRRAETDAEAVEAASAQKRAAEALAGLPDDTDARSQLAQSRVLAAEARTRLVEARAALDGLRGEALQRSRRLEALAADEASWRERAELADSRRKAFEERQRETDEELAHLARLPDEIGEKRRVLLSEIAEAERAARHAADALVLGEQTAAAADKTAREAENALAGAREERVRREAALQAADRDVAAVAARIAETMGALPDLAGKESGGESEAALRQTLDRLLRERDAMGAVNLMAETEAGELRQRIDTLIADREDLLGAIAKLRRGVAEINREGRERLLAAFEIVDRHFRDLFVRLFGGGRAHLSLTDLSDPLQAGLEIMASPPGKRLQVLSLLSGGEQALTALALLFAVFRSNPAPICVLDEVDAPLDDANVDRFCALVSEMTAALGTRFLVVTHHRMTMARMDRLFGVTMAERGVSTLVSVNLQKAEALSEAAIRGGSTP